MPFRLLLKQGRDSIWYYIMASLKKGRDSLPMACLKKGRDSLPMFHLKKGRDSIWFPLTHVGIPYGFA